MDCQHRVSQEEAPLVAACREVFENAAPSPWVLLAMLSPAPLLPFIRTLAKWLPTKAEAAFLKANNYTYDVCVHLMQV